MKRFLPIALIWSLGLSAGYADSLKQWSENVDKPEIQQKILNRVFSGQVGPLSAAILNKQTGVYLFPKNDAWVRIGSNAVYHAATPSSPEYLAITSMFYNKPDHPPITAAAYLLRDTTQRPEAISSGYAGQENVYLVKLPSLKREFLVLIDGFSQGNMKQTSGAVLSVDLSGRVRYVWKSPPSVREFRMGFSPLGAKEERLILRAKKSGSLEYSGYAWSGDRFEFDSFASPSKMQALPEDSWMFGSN